MTDEAPVSVGPTAYEEWRRSRLGAITEALEMRLILDLAGELAGRRVLDAGCGDGTLARILAARGAIVTAVDADPAMIAAARSRTAKSGKTLQSGGEPGDGTADGPAPVFLVSRLEDLPFEHGDFDLVLAVTVLCFVDDPARAVAEMVRVLRPGGRIVIGELGRWSTWAALRGLKARLGSRLWRAAHHRTAPQLKALLAGPGVTVEQARGAVFYSPIGPAARIMAGIDGWLGRRATMGAAFIAVAATTPEP